MSETGQAIQAMCRPLHAVCTASSRQRDGCAPGHPVAAGGHSTVVLASTDHSCMASSSLLSDFCAAALPFDADSEPPFLASGLPAAAAASALLCPLSACMRASCKHTTVLAQSASAEGSAGGTSQSTAGARPPRASCTVEQHLSLQRAWDRPAALAAHLVVEQVVQRQHGAHKGGHVDDQHHVVGLDRKGPRELAHVQVG